MFIAHPIRYPVIPTPNGVAVIGIPKKNIVVGMPANCPSHYVGSKEPLGKIFKSSSSRIHLPRIACSDIEADVHGLFYKVDEKNNSRKRMNPSYRERRFHCGFNNGRGSYTCLFSFKRSSTSYVEWFIADLGGSQRNGGYGGHLHKTNESNIFDNNHLFLQTFDQASQDFVSRYFNR